jgi:hypothetical protein
LDPSGGGLGTVEDYKYSNPPEQEWVVRGDDSEDHAVDICHPWMYSDVVRSAYVEIRGTDY